MIHGKRTTYRKQGCRCDACKRGHARYIKQYRYRVDYQGSRSGPPRNPMRVDADPIREHLHALLASGWTRSQIQTEAQLTSSAHLTKILRHGQPRIHRDIADRILALDPLEPVTYDEAVVTRLVDGYPVIDWRNIGGRAATREERAEALRRLDCREQRAWLKAQGYGDQQIDLPSFDAVSRWLGFSSADAKAAAA